MAGRKRDGSAPTRQISASHTSIEISPLPTPETLERYNQLVPDAAEVFVRSFEAEGRHRRRNERRQVIANIYLAVTGQVLAFLIFGGVSVGAFFLIREGREVAGTITAIAGLSAIVSLFINRRK